MVRENLPAEKLYAIGMLTLRERIFTVRPAPLSSQG